MFITNNFLKFSESNSYVEWFESEGVKKNYTVFEDDKLAEKLQLKLATVIPIYIGDYQSIGVLEKFRIIKLHSDLTLSKILNVKIKSKFEKIFYKILVFLNKSSNSFLEINGSMLKIEPFQSILIPEQSEKIIYHSGDCTTYLLCSALVYREKNHMFLEYGETKD